MDLKTVNTRPHPPPPPPPPGGMGVGLPALTSSQALIFAFCVKTRIVHGSQRLIPIGKDTALVYSTKRHQLGLPDDRSVVVLGRGRGSTHNGSLASLLKQSIPTHHQNVTPPSLPSSMNDFPVTGDPCFAHRILGSPGGQTLRVATKKCMAWSCFSVKSGVFGQRMPHFAVIL